MVQYERGVGGGRIDCVWPVKSTHTLIQYQSVTRDTVICLSVIGSPPVLNTRPQDITLSVS